MFRKPSNPAVLNSRAYIQKVVPVHNEMNRSKLLQAEAGLLLERNMSTVLRLQQSDEICDSNLSPSDPESLPPLIVAEKSYLRSHEPADEIQSKVPTQATLFSFGKNTTRESGRMNSRTPHVERLRLINRHPQPADDLDYDTEESENPSPEDCYAEYVKTHTLPSDPPLPILIAPPSASLLQGTAASLRRQSLPANQSRETFSSRLQGTIISQSKQTVPLIQNKTMARRYSSTTTTSPTDTVLSKSKYTAPNIYSCTGNTSADLTLRRNTDLSTRQCHKGVCLRSRIDQINKEAMSETDGKESIELVLGNLNRSKFWHILIVLAVADKASLIAVLQRREAAEIRMDTAIRCIVRLLRRWKAIRCALNNIRKGKVVAFSRLYSKIGTWRESRAANRIKDFLIASRSFKRPTKGFCASRVFHFLRAVRIVQHFFRSFFQHKMTQLAALEIVWTAYESKHISRMIRMVQISHGDCMNLANRDGSQVPGKRTDPNNTQRFSLSHACRVRVHRSQRRNSAPDGCPFAAVDYRWQRPAAQDEQNSFSRTQPISYSPALSLPLSRPWSPAGTGTGSGCGSEFRSYWSEDSDQRDSDPRPLKPTIEEMKAQRYNRSLQRQELKWHMIDKKFSSLITDDDRKRVEKNIIAANSLPCNDRNLYLEKIYKQARSERVEKYKESLFMQRKALEKIDIFTCADAKNLLCNDDDGLVGMVKHRLQQVELFVNASRPKKLSLPFIYYTSVIEDSTVQKFVKEVHQERKTFNIIGDQYSRFH